VLQKLTKAVIPAGGLSTRSRPISHVVPKEMFPIGNHPAIEWVIAEAVASGFKDIAVVINPRKQMIEEYLTMHCPALSETCRMSFLTQSEPLGIGHALILAKDFAAGQPVAVLLPDDLCVYKMPPLLQLKDIFARYGSAVFAMVEDKNCGRWCRNGWHLRRVNRKEYLLETRRPEFIANSEKPSLAGIGRYILSSLFISYGEKLLNAPHEGELDDGTIFSEMITNGEPVVGCRIDAKRYDISTFDGYPAAWRRFGKNNPSF